LRCCCAVAGRRSRLLFTDLPPQRSSSTLIPTGPSSGCRRLSGRATSTRIIGVGPSGRVSSGVRTPSPVLCIEGRPRHPVADPLEATRHDSADQRPLPRPLVLNFRRVSVTGRVRWRSFGVTVTAVENAAMHRPSAWERLTRAGYPVMRFVAALHSRSCRSSEQPQALFRRGPAARVIAPGGAGHHGIGSASILGAIGQPPTNGDRCVVRNRSAQPKSPIQSRRT
jgi:hypothetical protein